MEYYNDFKEILETFNKFKVQYLVVGAYAMGNYGYSRHTLDIDIWVNKTEENSLKIKSALEDFGVPYEIKNDEFTNDYVVFQIGVAPIRIDILTDIDGVDFISAWTNKTENSLLGEKIHFISLRDLIKNKKSTKRDKDLLDVVELEKLQKIITKDKGASR